MADRTEWKPNKKQAVFLSLPTTIKEGFYGGGAGSGKDLALDTLIPTSIGMKFLKDVHTGDFVYNHEGESVIVLAESEIFTDHKCYKVKFDNGQEIIAGEDHLWLVHPNQANRNKESKYKILKTKEILESNQKWSIIVTKPIQGNGFNCPIDPYTLGAWLGDGGCHDPKITSADLQIVNRINENYDITDYGYDYSYRILKIAHILKDFNLLQNKHIPELYFNSDIENRLALLQGLMDTDGTITPTGTGIELSLSDRKLALDCLRLIHSLGIKASCTINKSSYNGKNYKDRHRIKFATDLPIFSLNRKAERHLSRKIGHNSTRCKWHYIESIELVETVETKCIQVYGGIYLASESYIPTHNTDVLLMYGIINQWHENPRFKQVFMRRTRPDMKKEVVGRSRDIYSRFGATYNGTDMIWTFPRPDQLGSGFANGGAQIFLAHCEEEKDVHNFDSMEISLFTPDELTNCTEYIYLYIAFERNRAPKGSGLPSIVRAAGMPGGIGHTFVKKRFIDLCPQGGKIIVGKGGNKRIYVHAIPDDNLDHLDPTYIQSLNGRPDAEIKAKRFGDWSAYLGQVFDEFRDKKYPDEPDNALHVIEPFDIPNWWPKFCIGDWGFAAMTYIGFYAVSPQKRVYLYREIYWTKTKIEEWAPVVKSFVEQDNCRSIKFCKSASQDRGQEHTIQQQIEAALERPIELSNNSAGSRVAGKMLLHEYLRWKPKPIVPSNEMPIYSEEHAQWLYRNKGMIEYKSYLNMFNPPEEEKNIPRLQIFRCNEDNHDGHPNCCPVMIDSIKACSYDRKSKDGKPAEDVAEFEGDDPYDDIRYALDSAEKYFDEANEEFKRVVREATIIDQLKNSGDFTAFYRNMRSTEAANELPRMVKRFHGKR